MEMEKRRVCVTGAGGFVASWLVKLLLSKGYIVHGTVRDVGNEAAVTTLPALSSFKLIDDCLTWKMFCYMNTVVQIGDDKNAHLNKLDRASNNLKLFRADLLDYESLRLAIMGCEGVFHVACPVPTSIPANPEVEMLEPAIKGTHNVLRACSEANVKRVVYVSSTAAVLLNPGWPKDRVKDEDCWSDKDYCRATESWYLLAKTEAESAASEYGKQHGLDVVSVNPGYVFGPIMQPILNFSTLLLVQFVKGVYIDMPQGAGDSLPNKIWTLVDVRDVADALLLAYEKPEAEGRYICVAHNISTNDWVEKLRSLYPDFTYLENFVEFEYDYTVSSEKLQKLGWTYRPLEETLVDSIESYRDAALL